MNERPKSIERWSPNYTPCDPGREIACVVLHATAGARDGALATLCDPNSDNRVSAHYLIDKLGAIYHLVHEQNIAWHAGDSAWNGRTGINHISVGIEMENADDGKDPWTQPQKEACADLVAAICKDHNLPASAVVAHKDIAVPLGRKIDPAGFPFEQFVGMLKERGIGE